MKAKFQDVDWESKLSALSTEDAWKFFKEEYSTAEERFVPRKKQRIRNKPLWMKASVKKSVKKKDQL